MTINDVDKIFFLSLAHKPERINNVNNIVNNFNNEFKLNDKIKINYTTLLYLYDDMDIVNGLHKYFPTYMENTKHTINMFSCFFNHYNIIAESYFLKYNYILLFEDDAYIIDYNKFNTLLKNIPNDADVVQFVYNPFPTEPENEHNINVIDESYINEYYNKITNLHTASNACILLSNKVIESIYNFYVKEKVVYADAYQFTHQHF